jgi:hypothetical protein
MSAMRAEPCASEVMIGIASPARSAPDAHVLQHDGEQPGGDLLARGDDGVVFARSWSGEASLHQPTSSLVLPDMAETTTATSWPASTSRLTWRATLRMRSTLATDVPPNFMTRRVRKVT